MGEFGANRSEAVVVTQHVLQPIEHGEACERAVGLGDGHGALDVTELVPDTAYRVRVLAPDGGERPPWGTGPMKTLAPEQLSYYAHWITPSAEGKRFSARFYLAVLPAGQHPSFDAQETVDEAWVTPADALARAQALALPPPQVRILADLGGAATVDDALALAEVAAQHPHPIMPRMAPLAGGGFALLLPWDPAYATDGTGDSAPMPADHPLAVGPSRFVLEDRTWKNIAAPTSTTAG